jgi:hypothetical protein
MPLSRWLTIYLSVLPLAGCTVIGGVIGAKQDREIIGTREVPPARAGDLAPKTLIYVSIPGRETIKGRFREVSDSAGARRLRMKTAGGRESVPLDSISDLVAEVREKGHLQKGLVIGAAIDIVVAAFVLTLITATVDAGGISY